MSLLFPKPVRQKKEPKPLRRYTPLPQNRGGPDPAQFRESDFLSVWGFYPRCVQSGRFTNPGKGIVIERHHILGRGGKGDRYLFSSIFNCVPLEDAIHDWALTQSIDQTIVYLRVARERVMNAVALGEYVLKPVDEEFLRYADEWIRERTHPAA